MAATARSFISDCGTHGGGGRGAAELAAVMVILGAAAAPEVEKGDLEAWANGNECWKAVIGPWAW
jgi:hypothetical protein